MRLNQYIAACGVCSRREADRLIEAGEVLVDGVPARLGTSLHGDETVTVRGKVVESQQTSVVVAWYKPVGVTCTARDPHADRTVADAFRYPALLATSVYFLPPSLFSSLCNSVNNSERSRLWSANKEVITG